MFPDLLVALFTGLIVGAVVLGLERRLETRRAAADVVSRQMAAVDVATYELPAPYTFTEDSLVPLEKAAIRRVQKAVEGIPNFPTNEVGFRFELAQGVADTGAELIAAAKRLDAVIYGYRRGTRTINLTETELRRAVHTYVAAATPDTIQPGAGPIFDPVDDLGSVRAEELWSDERLQSAVKYYAHARLWAEALRRASYESDLYWRLKQWAISGIQYRDGRATIFGRWKSRRTAARDRARVNNEANRKALDIIKESAGPWLPRLRR
ncbi:hypothetical protein ACPW96_22690 [Micromonospora sp. DT81.3]|uniref:hypothetical protein n=1 Tax=Micromonospora sp. DT81.3 TaxID=3416523 RepID=UPI003CF187CE